MSDALNSDMNQSPPLDDSSQPVGPDQSIPLNATPHTLDGGWETINFPGALDVDAIPMEAAVTPARPEVVQWEEPDPDAAALICQLQQENVVLHSQVAQLEADLSQLQIELQLEVARYYCKEGEAAEASQADDRAPVDPAQAQIQHLAQAVETSQATQQQQQREIKSLTAQLNTSHQRIAQLERDCALSQQRYNEQLQLVSQAENTCQDLRMRLHRQQQQTLQFKAALEKSIEMNAVLETMQAEPIAPTEPAPGHTSEDSGVAFIPKAKPVQPWSGATAPSPHFNISVKHPGTGLPELLSRLAQPPATPTSAVVPEPVASELVEDILPPPRSVSENAVDAASKHLLEFLFPAQAAPIVADVPPPQAAVFDLSPFIEAGEVDAESLAKSQDEDPITTVIHHPPAAPPPPQAVHSSKLERPQDRLWADLAQLIEPDMEPTGVPPTPPPELTETTAVSASAAELEQHAFALESAQSLEVVAFPSLPAAPAAVPVTAHNPFPSFTLQVSDPVEATNDALPTESIEVNAIAAIASFPSPLLYPTRQPKKLASMAAVDLPSFPRG